MLAVTRLFISIKLSMEGEQPAEEPKSQRPSRKSKVLAIQGLQNMTAKKRKEKEQLDKEDGSEDRSADEDESEESEDEEIKRTRSRKKTTATAEKTGAKRGRKPGKTGPRNASTTKNESAPTRTAAATGKKNTNNSGIVPVSEADAGSLFEIVKQGRIALTTVIDEWIEAYKLNRDAALLDLIQFFINCSGCKGRITPHMYNTMEHAEIIRKMTEEFDEDSGDYPLIMSGPQWKKFKVGFCDFISTLVRQCQYSIIYDQYMMDNIISLLTGLTDSQVRAFRHTSTLAAMKLMTSMVDVALNLSIALDHTQRQYEAERSKNKNKQAADRLEILLEKRKEVEENQEEIKHMLTYIFKGVFVHRYRDIQPEIRVICTNEIGVWMRRYPTMFLDDSYLKYIGWTLYDRVGEVRLCCLKCLHPLYETEELAPKLELFTNRFKDRIVEMTLDKEYDVSVQAVKLVISIFKSNESILSDKDCENVYELVYCSHRGVAQAAGEFLTAKLFSGNRGNNAENEIVTPQKNKKPKKASENAPYWRDLVLFFIESELHEHGAYLVDSLWESCSMLKDWECMTSLLLDEHVKDEDALDDRQETSLIELMVCCVKQAATGEYPVGRGSNQRKLSSKELKQVAEDRTRLTEHFIVALPQLLAKYTMHSEKISNLLNIPLYFDLEIYTTGRHEKQLDQLLKHIDGIVELQTDPEVLENCSKVLEMFCNEEFAIGNKCNVFRMTLVDKVVNRFSQASVKFLDKEVEPSENDAYALLKSLDKLYAFLCCHDLKQWEVSDFLTKIIKDKQYIPKEILCKGVSCLHLCLAWNLASLDSVNVTEENLRTPKKKLKSFMDRLCILLKHTENSVQEEAYLTICDLLLQFNAKLGHNNPALAPLVYVPDSLMQDLLARFLNEKVFVEDEDDTMDENKKIEELHKRRNFLAGFCKLIIYDVIKIKCAADMFKYYIKFYNDYGDIIKHTLSKAREISKVQTAKTLALSLTQLFSVLQQEFPNGKVPTNSEGFVAIKDLARRFSQSFGLDLVRIREAIAYIHKDGILFVVNGARDDSGVPNNLAFLEILCEFSVKLMRQDKKVVLVYLDSHFKAPRNDRNDDWLSLMTYRHSLLMGDGDVTTATVAAGNRGTRKGKASAKRRLALDGEDTRDDNQSVASDNHSVISEVRRSSRAKRQRMNSDYEEVEASDHES